MPLALNAKYAVKTMTAICCGLLLLAAEAEAAPSAEPSLFDLSLEELLQVKVTSASFFERDALTVDSSVSVIERAEDRPLSVSAGVRYAF